MNIKKKRLLAIGVTSLVGTVVLGYEATKVRNDRLAFSIATFGVACGSLMLAGVISVWKEV